MKFVYQITKTYVLDSEDVVRKLEKNYYISDNYQFEDGGDRPETCNDFFDIFDNLDDDEIKCLAEKYNVEADCWPL